MERLKIITTKKEIGRVIEVNSRKIYPIIQTTTLEANNFTIEYISGHSIFIMEQNANYVLSLNNDEINGNEVLDLVKKAKIKTNK